MRVLIAVDGSSGSFEAVRQAASLLSPKLDRVALYYSPPGIRLKANVAGEAHFIERAHRALADAVFDEARTHFPATLREIAETIVGTQRPSHGITVAADAWKADLIVVGARGLGPLRRLLVGSVSRAVVHEATIPVLVVRPRRFPEGALKVLLALDNASAGERFGWLLRQFTWPAATVGRVVSVVPSIFAGEIPKWLEEQARTSDTESMSRAWVEEHEAEIKAKRDEMTACCRALPGPLQDSTPLVTEGYPADKILETAVREEVDLIVVGVRTLGTVSRLLLGSTSEAVLSHASCSVLVIRERGRP